MSNTPSFPTDISSKSEILHLASQLSETLEPNGIQLLINCAGIALDHSTRFSNTPSSSGPDLSSASVVSSHFLASKPSDWTESFATNVTGGFFMSMALLPLLERGSGRKTGYTSSIVNVSSNAAFLKDSCRGYVAYAASKAGTVHVSRMLASLLVGTSVRANQVAPGTFPSVVCVLLFSFLLFLFFLVLFLLSNVVNFLG